MAFGYSQALKTRLDNRAERLKVFTLVELARAATTRWAIADRDITYDNAVWSVDNPIATITPASIANERDLIEVTLGDPRGEQRNLFLRHGLIKSTVKLYAVESSTNELLEYYAGTCVAMAVQNENLVVRAGGLFIKSGSHHGVYASVDYQRGIDPNKDDPATRDRCMDLIAVTRELVWYR